MPLASMYAKDHNLFITYMNKKLIPATLSVVEHAARQSLAQAWVAQFLD